ncbi:alpha/beta hydrolase [Ralstonia syzygii subsp. celebesensis]|uniref:Alpha/beta hydrolase n=2 Tax=Ralstonia syzygii subsp. celebesensis TaxID=1310168 RepID=A0A1U9VFN3_9RALS|nr:alpha/beta hydrolase [Ralstonia syzygii]AQW29478.1 alpha/beta hydrolase [blood disease bacterium A2-HR MARDI]QQV56652.1 alpha/beta hydrolase [Ralstonia syzygii subsp. celebesensis]CCA79842.1 putative esterase/lipase protein [blood disease bacterium R229]
MGSSPPRLVVSERSLTAATAGTGMRPAQPCSIADLPDTTSAGELRVAASSLPGQSTNAPGSAEADTMARAVNSADYWTQGHASRIRLRVFRPARPADGDAVPLRQPAVLYLHGGGFVGGSIDDADAPARHLAATLPAVVVTVGYSLAPAAPFPAAPEDVYAALCCMAEHAATWGIDRRRLAVAGHDAGGNLSAALTMIARDRGGPNLRAQVLIAPMLDPTMARVRPDRLADADNTAEACAACYRQYLPRPTERVHPYAAPVESRRLHGLPPALLLTAPQDLLRTEAERYASALIEAGVATQIVRVADACHDSIATDRAALDEITCFLRWHLGLTRPATPRKRRARADRTRRAASTGTTGEMPG